MKSNHFLFIVFFFFPSCTLVKQISEEETIQNNQKEAEKIIVSEIEKSFPEATYTPLKFSNFKWVKNDSLDYYQIDHLIKLEYGPDSIQVNKFFYIIKNNKIEKVTSYYQLNLNQQSYNFLLYFYKKKTLPLRQDSFNSYANKDFYNELYLGYQKSDNKTKYLESTLKIIESVLKIRTYDLKFVCSQEVENYINNSGLYYKYEPLKFFDFYDLVEYTSKQKKLISEIEWLKSQDSTGYAMQIEVLENLLIEEGQPKQKGYHISHRFQSMLNNKTTIQAQEYFLNEYFEIVRVIPIKITQ